MSTNTYIKILTFTQIPVWAVAFYSFFFRSPDAGSMTVPVFMASLGLGIFLTGGLLIYSFKQKVQKSRLYYFPLTSSLRQGFLLAMFAVGTLLLALYNLFNLFDIAALALILVFAESFFKARFKEGKINKYGDDQKA